MECSRNKQFVSFKLCTIMSRVTQACVVLLHSAPDVNCPFVQMLPAHESLSRRLGDEISCHGVTALVFKWPSLYLILAAKRRRGDVGRSHVPQRSRKVLPVSEKAFVCVGSQ